MPHNLAHLSSRLPKSNYIKKRDEKSGKDLINKTTTNTTRHQPHTITDGDQTKPTTSKTLTDPHILISPPGEYSDNHLELISRRNNLNIRSMKHVASNRQERNLQGNAQISLMSRKPPNDLSERQSQGRASHVVTLNKRATQETPSRFKEDEMPMATPIALHERPIDSKRNS